jgi:thiol:disulfide interchange protein
VSILKPLFVAAALSGVMAAPVVSAAQKAPAKVAWQTNVDKAFAQAKKTKRLVMVDFYADY